ncbi:PGF-pre-PGF domain-containing protein [Methanolobus sp. ZRKC2]|uniref:PGF-pre-PGF domain-containing protein n=1 Tax=Methanolobus sp. ZRKC2 TaxID=3125783 RepID=UPI003249D889
MNESENYESDYLFEEEVVDEESGILGNFEETSSVSLSAEIIPTLSIEVTPNGIDFGTLAPRQSSDTHLLSIRNKGSLNAIITSEVTDVARDLYVDGILLDSGKWDEYAETVRRQQSIDAEVMLEVPEDFIGIGAMEGKLVFWAEMKGNQAPILKTIGNKTVNSSETLELVLSATDADGDELTYSMSSQYGYLHGNMFSWNTSGVENGIYEVQFSVSDGYASDSETIWVTLEDEINNHSKITFTLFSPESFSVTDNVGNSRTFNVSINEIANITWLLDGQLLHINYSVTTASCHFSSAEEGSHNLTVLAENINGTAQGEWLWNVTVQSTPINDRDSSSGKSRIKGIGYSGENYDNILKKVTKSQNVLAKKITTFKFDDNTNPITSISFLALKNSGVVATTIEILKDISGLVSNPPPGVVYKYLNIWVGDSGFATSDNIDDAKITFKVDKSWISENNIQDSSIAMYRYNDNKWGKLETRKIKEDSKFFYFESKTPGFSPFVITGDRQNLQSTIVDALRSTTDDELLSTDPSFEEGFHEDELHNESSSNVNKWIVIPLLLLLVAGFGAYTGIKKGIIPVKNKKYENVIFKDVLTQEVVADSNVFYDFENEENPIKYIRFGALDDSGMTESKVEVLRNRSGLVKSDPPGKVYRHLNIWIGAEILPAPSRMTDIVIGFRVSIPWLDENEFDASSVVLFRYADGIWHELPTEIVNEEDIYLVFESQTPGFSSFAICVL